MKLTIQHNIPQSTYKDLVVTFANLFCEGKFSALRKKLAEDAYVLIYNRERIDGAEAVIDYFKDWQARVGDSFECEVRWSAQFSQPEMYFNSEDCKQAYILTFEEGKVSRILLTVRSFSKVGFSIDENPYNVGFINANAPKEIQPLENHFFCPTCGKSSENLNWKEGVIFKEGPAYGKLTGVFVKASVCPDCNIVCEVSPDRTIKKVLSMTQEQQRTADGRMTVEELTQYVGNTMGNKKPLSISLLESKSNALAQRGKSFHELLGRISETKSVKEVLAFLNELSFENKEIKLHLASDDVCSTGDESFFYIGENENIDSKIHRYIKVKPSVEAAWQLYLLFTASTVMPVFWHGGYIVRDFIYDESQLNQIESPFTNGNPMLCYDMRGLSRANLLLPEVIMASDGLSADVYCTYWNDWNGLVRDHVQINFLKNGKIRLTQMDPLVLFEYDCGVLF